MISDNSLRRISDIFCGDTQGFYISMVRINMDKDFPPDGHMSIINLRTCSIVTASMLFLILFSGKII